MITVIQLREELKNQGFNIKVTEKTIIIGPSSNIESIEVVSIFGVIEEMAGEQGIELNLFELLLSDHTKDTNLKEIVDKANSNF